jgi:hypothetical protein
MADHNLSAFVEFSAGKWAFSERVGICSTASVASVAKLDDPCREHMNWYYNKRTMVFEIMSSSSVFAVTAMNLPGLT